MPPLQPLAASGLSLVAAPVLVLVLVLSGCGGAAVPGLGGEDAAEAAETPELGACRDLTPADVAQPSNQTETVPCAEPHTAQTYAVGEVPDDLRDLDHDDDAIGAFAYETCTEKLQGFLGADQSLALRTILSWAWFRPTEEAWAAGARWYRCDVVGGNDQLEELIALPETAEGLLLGRAADRWMTCVDGETVAEGRKVPCSQPHDWRAVTTIKLGEDADPYPGDRLVEVRTRDFCSDSVGAWLNYPVDYDYAYSYFHEAEWQAGNRRSICWARTPD
ncbi:septum formation family protein [Nocardioides nanhaiensis]|uniref:Septum formation-related domain-containing protein n=1 Tax=Nocardioides nanhaiensis TaxID=1476871 RepID=A0ABP8WQ83_9ACTN